MKVKFPKLLWLGQGVSCAIAMIAFFCVDFLFIKVLAKSGNLSFAIKYFIAQHSLGYLMLLIILIGSFLRWRASIIVNLLYSYFTVSSLIAKLAFSAGNAHFRYLAILSNVSLIMLIFMHLCGGILLVYLIQRKFRK